MVNLYCIPGSLSSPRNRQSLRMVQYKNILYDDSHNIVAVVRLMYSIFIQILGNIFADVFNTYFYLCLFTFALYIVQQLPLVIKILHLSSICYLSGIHSYILALLSEAWALIYTKPCVISQAELWL